jgi:hypothetical protein
MKMARTAKTRALAEVLSKYVFRHCKEIGLHENPEIFVEWLGERGYEIVPQGATNNSELLARVIALQARKNLLRATVNCAYDALFNTEYGIDDFDKLDSNIEEARRNLGAVVGGGVVEMRGHTKTGVVRELGRGVGTTSTTIQTVLVILKLVGVIDWPWVWVLFPFLFSCSISILLVGSFWILLKWEAHKNDK